MKRHKMSGFNKKKRMKCKSALKISILFVYDQTRTREWGIWTDISI